MQVEVSISIDGKPVYDPAALYEQAAGLDLDTSSWLGRANSFTARRGKEASRGWFLLKKSDTDSLLKTVTIHFACGESTLDVTAHVISTSTLYANDPDYPDATTLVLIEVADARAFREVCSIPEDARFNIINDPFSVELDTTPYLPETLNGEAFWTWQEVLEELWAYLPNEFGTCPTMPGVLPEHPDDLDYTGWNAWDAVYDLILQCCHEIYYDHTSGSFETFEVGDNDDSSTQDQTLNSLRREYVATTFTEDQKIVGVPRLPSFIAFFFPRRDENTPNTRLPHSYRAEYSPGYAEAGSGTGVSFWCTYRSVYDTATDNEADPLNKAECDSIVNILSANLYGFFPLLFYPERQLYHTIIPGFFPNGRFQEITWRDTGDGMYTELVAVRKMLPGIRIQTDANEPSTPIHFELYGSLEQYVVGDPAKTPTAARRRVKTDLTWCGIQIYVTDCDDIIYVADFCEEGFSGAPGAKGHGVKIATYNGKDLLEIHGMQCTEDVTITSCGLD